MEMVAVCGIEVWAERYAKIAARPAMNLAQELAFDAGAVPVLEDTDAVAIGQCEGRYVNGIGGGVLTSRVAPHAVANDVPTAVGSNGVNSFDLVPQKVLGHWLQNTGGPQCHGRRHFTTQRFTGNVSSTGPR